MRTPLEELECFSVVLLVADSRAIVGVDGDGEIRLVGKDVRHAADELAVFRTEIPEYLSLCANRKIRLFRRNV